jgi:hypothetical protein
MSDLTIEQHWLRVTLEVRTDSRGATGTAVMFPKPAQPEASGAHPELRFYIPSGQLVEVLSACHIDCTALVDFLIKPWCVPTLRREPFGKTF